MYWLEKWTVNITLIKVLSFSLCPLLPLSFISLLQPLSLSPLCPLSLLLHLSFFLCLFCTYLAVWQSDRKLISLCVWRVTSTTALSSDSGQTIRVRGLSCFGSSHVFFSSFQWMMISPSARLWLWVSECLHKSFCLPWLLNTATLSDITIKRWMMFVYFFVISQLFLSTN